MVAIPVNRGFFHHICEYVPLSHMITRLFDSIINQFGVLIKKELHIYSVWDKEFAPALGIDAAISRVIIYPECTIPLESRNSITFALLVPIGSSFLICSLISSTLTFWPSQ